MPFGFGTAWRSNVTGLVSMRARWYSSQLGEFFSPDPIGAADSFNLYAYAAFDPINRLDPWGLEETDLVEARKGSFDRKISPMEVSLQYGARWGAVRYLKGLEWRVESAQWFLIENGPTIVAVSGVMAQGAQMSMSMGTMPPMAPPLLASGRALMAHPMHLHGHHFQVVAIGGRRFSGAVRDTVIVPPHTPVTIAFDATQRGAWLLHCHHLYHMATGMMTEVRIV